MSSTAPATGDGTPPRSPPVAGESTGDDPAPAAGPTRYVALGVAALVIALIAVLAVGSGAVDDDASAVLGARVPPIDGPTLSGGSYDIDDARGRWVVVNFFATWCPGCINEHPELVEFDRWAAETGRAEVVAVVFNDTSQQVESFFASQGGGWPVLDEPSVPIAFQVAQIPETFLVAPNGKVVRHIRGEVTAADLIAFIESS